MRLFYREEDIDTATHDTLAKRDKLSLGTVGLFLGQIHIYILGVYGFQQYALDSGSCHTVRICFHLVQLRNSLPRDIGTGTLLKSVLKRYCR